jgi:putative Holliday junction resolvase
MSETNQADPLPLTGRLLALDIGEKRLGVAVCDERQTLASPLLVLERRSKAEDLTRLTRLAAEQGAAGLLAGHPLNADGSAGPQARQAARYAARVASVLALPLLLWDEHGSSQEAAARLAHAPKRRRQAHLDAEAAAVILQDYLDGRRRGNRK